MNGLADILKAIEPLGLPVYSRADIALINGDSRQVAENCIDSIVCDPPYGLSSNEKRSLKRASPSKSQREKIESQAGGFMGMKWDSDVPPTEHWAEFLRVAKPGAHLLAFGGTRTYHRME